MQRWQQPCEQQASQVTYATRLVGHHPRHPGHVGQTQADRFEGDEEEESLEEKEGYDDYASEERLLGYAEVYEEDYELDEEDELVEQGETGQDEEGVALDVHQERLKPEVAYTLGSTPRQTDEKAKQVIRKNCAGKRKAWQARKTDVQAKPKASQRSKKVTQRAKASKQRDAGDKESAVLSAEDELKEAFYKYEPMEVTISLTFVFASLVGELYFVMVNSRRFLVGRWTESYIITSFGINVGLALLLESLISALPSIASAPDCLAACTWLTFLYSVMRLYHERQGVDCVLKAISRFPLIFIMVFTMVTLKTLGSGVAGEEDEAEEEEEEDEEALEGTISASGSAVTMASSAQ